MPRQAQTHWVSHEEWDGWPRNSIHSDHVLQRTGKSFFNLIIVYDTPFSHFVALELIRSTFWWLEWALVTWPSTIAPRRRHCVRPPQSVPQALHRLPFPPSKKSTWPVTPSFSWSSWHHMVSKLSPKKSKTTPVKQPAPQSGRNPPLPSEVWHHLFGFNLRRVNHLNQELQAARKTFF